MTAGVVQAVLAVALLLLVLGAVVLADERVVRRTAQRRAALALRSEQVPRWRRAVDDVVGRSARGRALGERLRRAGHADVLVGDVVLLTAAGAVGVVVAAAQLVVLPVAVLLALGALRAADAVLSSRVRRRSQEFAAQLPDIARTVANAAGAGIAIPGALALASREVDEPARSLLRTAVQQMEVGQSLAGAMAAVQAQAPSREMGVLVTTLVIQQRTGGDVIEALREMSGNLERRRDLRREVDATMAGVRYSSYAVMGLGVAVLGLVELLDAGTLRRLTGSLGGQVVLVISGGLYAVGFTALRRLTRVDV